MLTELWQPPPFIERGWRYPLTAAQAPVRHGGSLAAPNLSVNEHIHKLHYHHQLPRALPLARAAGQPPPRGGEVPGSARAPRAPLCRRPFAPTRPGAAREGAAPRAQRLTSPPHHTATCAARRGAGGDLGTRTRPEKLPREQAACRPIPPLVTSLPPCPGPPTAQLLLRLLTCHPASCGIRCTPGRSQTAAGACRRR